jgi:hypothetical protein
MGAADPGGEMACPKTPPREGRDFGVRATMLLLSDKGRAFGVFWRFCASDKGSFLTVETGRTVDGVLLGVAVGVWTLALILLFPGAVMESLPAEAPNRFGVAGMGWTVPSLVVGLLPLLDMAEAGRNGGGMLLSALKKLDLRLPLPGAGDDGSWARLSMVLSDSDGRDFFFVAVSSSGSFSKTCSGLGSKSWSLS